VFVRQVKCSPATAALWNDQLSPAIEAARMGGKQAVTNAGTPELIAQAKEAAVAALQLL
jgi:hypothetical protein